MPDPRIIEIEAETLEEAREQIKSQIPEGLHLLSEQVVSDGKPKTTKAQADTTEMAFAQARGAIPDNASILEEKVLSAPEQKVIKSTIEAPDEQSAKTNSEWQMKEKGHPVTVRNVRLVVAGKKGFLGIGSTHNQYEVELLESQPAVVEVTYKTKAKLIARVGELETSPQAQDIGETSMSANTLDQIINHLQFLGYEITQKNELRIASCPKKMTANIRVFKGGILFTAFNRTESVAKSDVVGFLRFINTLNTNAAVARFYADKDFDLAIEAWYPDFYEKSKFGVFWDAWETDSFGLLVVNAEEAMKYLK